MQLIQRSAPGEIEVTSTSRRHIVFLASVGLLVGCYTDLGKPREPVTLEVSPFQTSVTVGATVRLFASALDRGGHVIGAGRTFSWRSLSPNIATVDGEGRVTGVTPGQARIRAALGALSSSGTVTVLVPPPARVTVELPPALGPIGRGDIVRIVARAFATSGSEQSGRSFTWDSSDPTVVSVTPNADGVSANALALAPGTAVVTATNLGVGGSVTVTIAADAVIQFGDQLVSFRGVVSGADPASRTVAITNAGGGSLRGLSVGSIAYPPNRPSGWLSAEILGAATAAPQLRLTATTRSLAVDSYTARVTLVSSAPAVDAQGIDVALIVETRPVLVLASSAANFGASVGGAAPPAQLIAVQNGGGSTLTGLAVAPPTAPNGSPAAWLTASLLANTAPTSLRLAVNPAGLAAGNYLANVTVTAADADGSPKTVAVTLVVSAGAVIVLTPSSLPFTAAPGSTPAPQLVALSNGGAGALTGLSIGPVVYGAGQPQGWLPAPVLSAPSTPAQVTVSPTTVGLAANNTYNATFEVRSSLPGVAAAVVSVSITVRNVPVIMVNPAQAALTANSPAPPSTPLAITAGGSGNLTGLVAAITYAPGEPNGWLTATFAVGVTSAPTSLIVRGDAASLGPGLYSATVRLSSPDAPATLNVPVTLRVIGSLVSSASSVLLTGVAEIGTGSPMSPNLTNVGAGIVSGLTATVSAGAAAWLTATLNANTAPAQLTIQLRPDAVSPRGTSNGTITVTGNGVNPLVIPVSRKLIFTYDQHVRNPARNRDRWRDMGPGVNGCAGCHGSTWDSYTYLTTTFSTRDPTRKYIDNTSTDVTRSFLYVYFTTVYAPPPSHSGGLLAVTAGNRPDSVRLWILDGSKRNTP